LSCIPRDEATDADEEAAIVWAAAATGGIIL
jgi:hypothetical protein